MLDFFFVMFVLWKQGILRVCILGCYTRNNIRLHDLCISFEALMYQPPARWRDIWSAEKKRFKTVYRRGSIEPLKRGKIWRRVGSGVLNDRTKLLIHIPTFAPIYGHFTVGSVQTASSLSAVRLRIWVTFMGKLSSNKSVYSNRPSPPRVAAPRGQFIENVYTP